MWRRVVRSSVSVDELGVKGVDGKALRCRYVGKRGRRRGGALDCELTCTLRWMWRRLSVGRLVQWRLDVEQAECKGD